MLKMAVRRIPPSVVVWIGQAQFRYPTLGRLVRRFGQWATSGDGVIARGVGKGLRFDAGSDGKPGYLLGTTDPQQQQFLCRHLQPGDVFYDLGAHLGFFAVLAAKLVGHEGRVYAFEPFPESAARVRRNAQINHFTQLEVIEAAVSDSNGVATLGSPAADVGTDSFGLKHGSDGGLDVRVLSIDTWCTQSRARAPKLVMIDVEGAEINVLRGMMTTIIESRPVLQIEVHWLGRPFLDAFDELLKPLGYTLSNLDGGPLPEKNDRWQAVATPSNVTKQATE